MVERGNNFVAVKDQSQSDIVAYFALRQNYPNPFNARTTISYSLLRTSIITVKVYDAKGCEIATLVQDEKKAAGKHEIVFDAGNLPSGIYFYRLSAENFVETKKALLIK